VLDEVSEFKVVKHKDRFEKPIAGYDDHLIVVEVAPGMNAEVQVHRLHFRQGSVSRTRHG
jgi:hypothetical protein